MHSRHCAFNYLKKGLQAYKRKKCRANFIGLQGAVWLTYLGILKEGFTPIFSATLSYGKRAFHHKKTGVTFPISLGKCRPSITFHIA